MQSMNLTSNKTLGMSDFQFQSMESVDHPMEDGPVENYTIDLSQGLCCQIGGYYYAKLDDIIPRIPAIPDHVIDKLTSKFVPSDLVPTAFLSDVQFENVVVRTKKYLADKNSHPMDERIVFIECSKDKKVNIHKYFVDGSCLDYLSVTGLISAFFSSFDAKSQATTTANSKSFLETSHRPSHKYHGCKTPQDIIDKWAQARDLGTDLHANIESYWNNENTNVSSENQEPFAQFLSLFSDKNWVTWEPFRTEFAIFDTETKIAGQIDFLGMIDAERKHVVIIDWKRCESITDFSFSRICGKPADMGCGVCCTLEDTKYTKYSIQLNIYKYLLEKNYGLYVKKMYLVQMHPCLKKSGCAIYKVPNMKKLVEEIMATRKIALNISKK